MGPENFEKPNKLSNAEDKNGEQYEDRITKAHKKDMKEVEEHGGLELDEVLDIEGIEELERNDDALSIPPEIERIINDKSEGLNNSQMELLRIAASLANRYVEAFNKYVIKKPESLKEKKELIEEMLESISLKYDNLDTLKRSDDEFGAAFEMIKELREYVESMLESENPERLDMVLNNITKRIDDFNYDIFLGRADDEYDKNEAKRAWRYVMDTIFEKKLKRSSEQK